MNKSRHISLAAILLFAFSAALPAQQRRFETVSDRNLWLHGGNVTGIRVDSVSISHVQIDGGYVQGDNRRTWDGNREWTVGARTASIKHFNKFSVAGSFSFDQKMMYDACGSMFINPGFYPVDILEFTPGSKSQQRYHLDGGISVDVAPNLRVGAMFGYTAYNYSKTKDLRYSDFAMDLALRPGLQWHSGPWSVGFNLSLEHNAETISAEQIGTAAESYYAFLDKGMHYGEKEIWTGSGVHLSEAGISGFPVKDLAFGGGVQFGWKGLYVEAAYLRGSGSVGEKDAIWFLFPTDRFSGTLAWKMHSALGTEHILRLDAFYKSTRLDEAVMEKRTSGGVTTRIIHGYNDILNKGSLGIKPSWSAVNEGNYEIHLALGYRRDDGLGTMQYPWINSQVLRSASADVELRGTTFDIMTIICHLNGGKGWLEDGTSVAEGVSAKQEQYRQADYYEQWKWYETTAYFGASLGLRFDFRPAIYVQGSFGVDIRDKKTRMYPRLMVGYTF